LIINDFNEYSAQQNLNITLELTVYRSSNVHDDYASYIESILKKKGNKFDIYFYDNSYTTVYGNYLLNLKNYLDPSHTEIYDPKIISETCIYENKLVGLVCIKE